MILRALSLGARSGERGVAMHALQLLTKAVLDDLAEDAAPEVLQEVMLSIVFPLGRHVWLREIQAVAGGPRQQRRHQPHGSNSNSSNNSSSISRKNSSQGGAGEGGGGGGGSGGGAGEERQASPSEEDGFELVEAPDDGPSPGSAASDTPVPAAAAVTAAAGGGGAAVVGRGRGRGVASPPAVLRREPSSERGGWEDGGGAGGRGGGRARAGVGAGAGAAGKVGVQVSSPGLLALLLVLKSFLKHLSALRRAGGFEEVWRR
ncbi:unnamed protein product, partial [Laminaria digitata]